MKFNPPIDCRLTNFEDLQKNPSWSNIRSHLCDVVGGAVLRTLTDKKLRTELTEFAKIESEPQDVRPVIIGMRFIDIIESYMNEKQGS